MSNPKRARGGWKHGHLPEGTPDAHLGYYLSWINSKPSEPYPTKNGYVEIDIRDDFEWMAANPNKVRRARYLKHQYVMEKHLGRYLTKGETIHHKNGIKNDNRLENLELWNGNHPSGVRLTDQIDWAKKLLKENGYTVD